MRAREFTKRIELWQIADVADGYGGNTVSNTLITTVWAKVETFSSKSGKFSSKLSDFGILSTQTAIVVKLRKRADFDYNSINQFIKYKGVIYTIATFPTNNDFNNSYIEFVAVREILKTATSITPIT